MRRQSAEGRRQKAEARGRPAAPERWGEGGRTAAGGPASPGTVAVHIEELVLHGFAPGDRQAIGAAVEQELARLFAGQPLPAVLARDGRRDRIDGGSFPLARGTRPGKIGAQIATAIHGGLDR